MNTYIIKKVDDIQSVNFTEYANKATVNYSPWKGYESPYNTNAYLLYDDENIYVYLTTDEKEISVTQTKRDCEVCVDSCMEFFLIPNENDDRYLNFEVNAGGTLHLGIGKSRFGRSFFKDTADEVFDIKTDVTSSGWSLSYKIPFEFINSVYAAATKRMLGNFYKCGDETKVEHYAVWNDKHTAEPDFHAPSCFGVFILEE